MSVIIDPKNQATDGPALDDEAFISKSQMEGSVRVVNIANLDRVSLASGLRNRETILPADIAFA